MTTETDAWIELADTLGEREFVARHPGFFLVSSDQLGDAGTLFTTDVVDFGKAGARVSRRKAIEVRWIAKPQDHPYSDRISVGRARNCDVSFRHPSVSKLHAHFRTEGGRLTVTDLRSKNGTWINGKVLSADQPIDVRAHDRVRFGAVEALVVEGAEIFELLASSF